MFDLTEFIAKYVTKRPHSMFQEDIDRNYEQLSEKIKNKTVLVIGGAGSIGSSFVRAILPFEPAALVVVDTNENALAELTRDIRSTKGLYVPVDYVPYPMDYSSDVFVKMFKSRGGFDIVANFAAHKHVRSEKDVFSIEALLRNNVISARKLLDLLEQYPPQEYFCVSTDKAANPVNIMGASKRVMEDLIFAYSDKFLVKTARFANVAFSNGSLPAGFIDRLKKHQPLSAPSDVRRYFVSPEESGQICMLACMLGENREIFFPKLEEAQMMTFDAIATELLREHGYEPLLCDSDEEAIQKMKELNQCNGQKKEYPVHYAVSDTSGEKDFEEFFTGEETVDNTRFRALGVIVEKEFIEYSKVKQLIDRLENIFDKDAVSKEEIVEALTDFLPSFNHIEMGKGLDSKM